jgi:hypothetical protein
MTSHQLRCPPPPGFVLRPSTLTNEQAHQRAFHLRYRHPMSVDEDRRVEPTNQSRGGTRLHGLRFPFSNITRLTPGGNMCVHRPRWQ